MKKFGKISPHLPVRDVRETIRWYEERLGFSEPWFWGDPPSDGGCRRDDLRVLFGKADPFVPPQDLSLILFVSGIDEVYEEIVERGHKILSPVKTYDYGIREFAIEDVNGYYLRFAESVEV